MKSNKIIVSKSFLYFLIFLQIMAVVLLFDGTMILLTQVFKYKGATSFTEIEARCVKSKKYTSSSEKRYNNTYEYIVDDNVYQVTFHGEKDADETKKLYYNPTYPPTCSKYKNLWIALICNSLKFILGVIAQVFFIKYLLKRRKAL